MTTVLLFVLLACAGSTPSSDAKVAAPTPQPPTPTANLAVGPDGPESISVPTLSAVSSDAAAVTAGQAVFASRGCGACHKFGEKLVGPDLKGVLSRRSSTWVERMVTDPEVMTKQDPVAKGLFRTLMVQMTKQGVTPEEMPNLLAYIKSQGG